MANSASDSTWLTSLLDASGAAMVGVDAPGLTVFWSLGAQTLFGWSPEDVLGTVPPIVPTALCQEWQLQMQGVLETGQPSPAAETQRMARDGRIIPVVRSAAPLHDSDGTIIGLAGHAHRHHCPEAIGRGVASTDAGAPTRAHCHGLARWPDSGPIRGADDPGCSPAGPGCRGRWRQRRFESARVDIERVIEETRSYVFDLRARAFAPRDLGSGLRLLADGCDSTPGSPLN